MYLLDKYSKVCYIGFMSSQSPKAKYYGEDYSTMTDDQKFELIEMESREATGILWRAALHIRDNDKDAFLLLNRLRDELIDEDIAAIGTKDRGAFKTMFLYRMNTAGVPSPFFQKISEK
jgi:hypothetical protein